MSFHMYFVLDTTSRNTDHPFDHMCDSLLAKYFISHLGLEMGDKQDLENRKNMELWWGKQSPLEQQSD